MGNQALPLAVKLNGLCVLTLITVLLAVVAFGMPVTFEQLQHVQNFVGGSVELCLY